MPANEANIRRFTELYIDALTAAVRDYPNEYQWPVKSESEIYRVAQKMIPGLISGGANKDSRAVKAVCKQLGIRHTYKAIREYMLGA